MAQDRGRVSARTSGKSAEFLWRYCASGRHIEEAVDALMAEVDRLTRGDLGPYKRSAIRSVFRARIKKAAAGDLEPQEECKPIRKDPEVYEIRWSDVRVPVKGLVDGLLEDRLCHYRLYYGEPPQPDYFLGLHAHEKVTRGLTPSAIDAAQEAEIECAVMIYKAPDSWGVPEIRL